MGAGTSARSAEPSVQSAGPPARSAEENAAPVHMRWMLPVEVWGEVFAFGESRERKQKKYCRWSRHPDRAKGGVSREYELVRRLTQRGIQGAVSTPSDMANAGAAAAQLRRDGLRVHIEVSEDADLDITGLLHPDSQRSTAGYQCRVAELRLELRPEPRSMFSTTVALPARVDFAGPPVRLRALELTGIALTERAAAALAPDVARVNFFACACAPTGVYSPTSRLFSFPRTAHRLEVKAQPHSVSRPPAFPAPAAGAENFDHAHLTIQCTGMLPTRIGPEVRQVLEEIGWDRGGIAQTKTVALVGAVAELEFVAFLREGAEPPWGVKGAEPPRGVKGAEPPLDIERVRLGAVGGGALRASGSLKDLASHWVMARGPGPPPALELTPVVRRPKFVGAVAMFVTAAEWSEVRVVAGPL